MNTLDTSALMILVPLPTHLPPPPHTTRAHTENNAQASHHYIREHPPYIERERSQRGVCFHTPNSRTIRGNSRHLAVERCVLSLPAPLSIYQVVDFDNEHWEQDAEELLSWSTSLDYDAYLHDWAGIGTSSAKELVNDPTMASSSYHERSSGSGAAYSREVGSRGWTAATSVGE